MVKKPVPNALWYNFFGPKEDWVEETVKICVENRLFKGFTPSVIRWLAARMHPRHYDAGEKIFSFGDEGAGAILLRSGTIAIRNKGVELATMRAGDMFGEVALVEGQARTADAIAIKPCELVFLLRTDLDEWVNSHPKHACRLLKNLSSILAERLLESNRTVSRVLEAEGRQ